MRRAPFAVCAGALLALTVSAAPVLADPAAPAAPASSVGTPSPSAGPSASTSTSESGLPSRSDSPSAAASPVTPSASRPTGTASMTPAPGASSAGPTADRSATPTAGPVTVRRRAAQAAPAVTTRGVSLTVRSAGSPVAGQYFEDLGSYHFSGVASPGTGGTRVEVWSYGGDRRWHRIAVTTTDSDGSWTASRPVTVTGLRRFRATLGGDPSVAATIASPEVRVTVQDARVTVTRPAASFDALSTPTVKVTVFPARAGVLIHFRVRSTGAFRDVATRKTDSHGRAAFRFTTGKGVLHSYGLRARYWDHRGRRWELSPMTSVRRTRVLHAVTSRTTAADVARTYRAGCPVGPSQLRTVRMNYQGFDNKMHRGIIIVRADRARSVIAAFRTSLGKRIRRMDNPNVWGGNDPRQMEADNTSGFNCRKVTGNPYAQSPHSYGIALDINTRENPYRDVTGKWWPSSGRSYIDRTPFRRGMLTKASTLTKALRSRGYFWGGRWYPGRDYQHFEYR